MSQRFCAFAASCLFAAAVLLAAVDLWLGAGLCVSGCMYFAGRYQGAAELDQVLARERRLDDELNDRHRRMTNGAGYLSPAVLNDRNSTTTASRGARAQVRSARP